MAVRASAPGVLVGQSGGPTAVINASLAGVVAEAQASPHFGRVLGMRNGVLGAIEGRLADLTDLGDGALDQLRRTPSSALGSCRYKLADGDAERLVRLCRDEGIGAFIYIGGNDSADTAEQVRRAAEASGKDLVVVGVPKTIDNDLPGMDHAPGYGSAGRFLAQTTREAALDTLAMKATDPIKLVEVMGRHAGWLPGASWLARERDGDAPHLVYVPERPVRVDQVIADVAEVYRRLGWCVVVLCENQPDPSGVVIGAESGPRWVDPFGHAYFDSPAQHLAQHIAGELGVRARFDKPGTIQRMASAYVSTVDCEEAELVGRVAVQYAARGISGVMVALERLPGSEYAIKVSSVPLGEVANQAKKLPAAYVNAAGNGMTQAFEEYASPLLGGPLPSFARL